ncbi:MAG TPA: divalent metal cation transporter [Pyrinomonadaceae bacterium]|nr:divalent metal cation transporter [Pyrinomonadaceae bacterium]
MKKFVEIFLGILTAMGGFVEVGELVFSVNAGAKFGFHLLWVVALGTIGIIAFCEMAGRVAAVKEQPVFNLIRERAGLNAGLVTLVAANLVNLLTCTAEIGGIALLWQLLSGWPYRWLALLALVFLLAVVWILSFQWIERVFGLLGLLLCVYLGAAYYLRPDWTQVAAGFVPNVPRLESSSEYTLFAYFVVAILSSVLLPYEVYFYASGAIEDGWNPSDVNLNRIISIIGSVLGSLLAVALMVCGAQVFRPLGVEPQLPGEAALAASMTFGKAGLLAAIGGMFFAFAGAAIETALSGAYNLAQFFGWPWGKFRPARKAARFSLTWMITFALSALVIMTGVDPVSVVEYSIVFSVVILPFTYFPVLVIARDKELMGEEHANGRFANAVGWFYLAVITLAALAAVPLLIATRGGKG